MVKWPIGASVGALVLAALSAKAAAYDAGEHEQIGRESYQRACDALQTRLAGNEPALAHLARLCTQEFVNRYGQATRLSGDHLEGPALWRAQIPEGIRQANDFVAYVNLALGNESHFHPVSREEWKKDHLAALAAARAEASSPADDENRFLAAFYLNAFADHFLQDSFAAGHSGFARGASLPNAAKAFHDRVNAKGRTFRNPAGDVWVGYGDGDYASPEHEQGRAVLLRAATASVTSMLLAVVTRAIDSELELEVLNALPSEGKGIEWKCMSDDNDAILLRPAVDCDPIETSEWHPIDAIMKPAFASNVVAVAIVGDRRDGLTSLALRTVYPYQARLRLVYDIGMLFRDERGKGVDASIGGELSAWRRQKWNTPAIHELIVRGEGRLGMAFVGDDEHQFFTVQAELAYRLTLQLGAHYQLLWFEPSVGYERGSESVVRGVDVIESHRRRGAVFGVALGWGMLLGVKGGGMR